jgi:mycothiol synthase
MSCGLRPARPDDAVALHRLVRRIEVGDGLPLVTPLEELEEWATDPHLSLAADTRVAEEADEIVGYGRLWFRGGDGDIARVFLLGGVDPAARGRGLGRAIFGWQLARAREILSLEPPHRRRHLRTQAYDFERGAIALYERHGLRPIRTVEELLRPLDELPPPVAIAGVEIRPWDPARNAAALAVYNDGFGGTASTTALDDAAWAHHLASAGMRLDLSRMAWAGERLVGIALNECFPDDETVTGRRDGWIRHLATLRDHRGRGVGAALLRDSFVAFRAAGLTHAILGVDSDNPTGASRLYERVGFRPLQRSVQHQLELAV